MKAVFLLAALSAATANAQHFTYNATQPSTAWRFGSATLSDAPGGLILDNHQKDVTLSATAFNPGNLRTFSATLRFTLSTFPEPTLTLGLGKPAEWSGIDESQTTLTIDHAGLVTAKSGPRTLGTVQLTPTDGVYTLTVTQQPHALRIAGKTFPAEPHPGYLALHIDHVGPKSDAPFKIQSVEISSLTSLPPISEAQRKLDIQIWAKHREDQNWPILDTFKAEIAADTAAGTWGFHTDLQLSPALIQPGETIKLRFHLEGPIPTQNSAQLEPSYLTGTPPAPQSLQLLWQPDGPTGHAATLDIAPTTLGNHRIVWKVGDETLIRDLAVVGPGYTVARILFTNYKGPWTPGHASGAYDVVHTLGLPADFWTGDEWASPFGRTPKALTGRFAFFSRNHHLYGDHIIPLANANWLIPGDPDANLWRFNDDIQRQGIQQISQLWQVLGLGDLEILGGYTFGHSTPQIARSLGVKVMDSLIQWQNWRDGGSGNSWLINDLGAPIVPYFMAKDDFRKVAPGQSILGFTQGTTSNVRLYDIMTTEGQPQLSFRRAHSPDNGESNNVDRFHTIVDVWLNEAIHQQQPLFVSIGLENFVDSADWDAANTSGIRYLRDQARTRKLVFASSGDIAGYFERHYPKQPENWIVWPDIYAGQSGQYKPLQLPVRIETSNAKFHTVHEQGSALPRFFWDFTIPWSAPVWSDDAGIRPQFGLVRPDLITANNSVPRMVDLTGIKAIATWASHGNPTNVDVTLTFDTPKPIATLPIALWNLPLEPDGIKATSASSTTRFVPVVDGGTGNTDALAVCTSIPAGHTVRILHLHGEPAIPINPEVQIGTSISGRMFLRGTTPRIYLWLSKSDSPAGTLTIHVPAGHTVTTHDNTGEILTGKNGETLTLTFDRTWQHESPLVTGLTPAELQASATFQAK